MPDILWPEDLRPSAQTFYLQPHVGGQESPLTRTRKVYGLSAPRWIARVTLTARAWGGGAQAIRAGRIEGLIADLEGGLNRLSLWDFRRETTIRPQSITATLTTVAASRGSTTMSIAGFSPYSTAFSVGDYVGGDGRPHLVTAVSIAGPDGVAQVTFKPPLSADVPSGPAVVSRVPGWFRLMSEDAGNNDTAARQRTSYTLEFVEALP
jgi:hypothetical protein